MRNTDFQVGEEKLREAGHKCTPQRKAILELFARGEDHWTPQQIHTDLEKSVPSLSLATVYNTLDVFEELALVQRVTTTDGLTYFDTNLRRHHHGRCDQCSAVFDVNVAESALNAVVKASSVATVDGARVHAVANLWFQGTCAACQP